MKLRFLSLNFEGLLLDRSIAQLIYAWFDSLYGRRFFLHVGKDEKFFFARLPHVSANIMGR